MSTSVEEILRGELSVLRQTLRRNRAQHRPGLYYQALCIAEKRARRTLIDRSQRDVARAAVLRASFRVRSVLADGFFLPLATCWFASLARIFVLLEHMEKTSENDDLGLPTEQAVCSSSTAVCLLPEKRRAVDVVYSSDSSEEDDDFEIVESAQDAEVSLVIDRSSEDASRSLLWSGPVDDEKKQKKRKYNSHGSSCGSGTKKKAARKKRRGASFI